MIQLQHQSVLHGVSVRIRTLFVVFSIFLTCLLTLISYISFQCLEYDDNDRDESFDEHDFATTTQTSNYSKKRGHDGDHINGQHGNGGHESGESNDGESSSTSNDSVPKKRRRKENATFMAGVQGVTLVTDQVSHFYIFLFLISSTASSCITKYLAIFCLFT